MSVLMSAPSTQQELELYRVLQKANLLQYYNTFISQGGDDVSQLCEAGEEEFLEIMALVGMASKPLHVRRLQKVLQEWLRTPDLFRAPVHVSNSISQLLADEGMLGDRLPTSVSHTQIVAKTPKDSPVSLQTPSWACDISAAPSSLSPSTASHQPQEHTPCSPVTQAALVSARASSSSGSDRETVSPTGRQSPTSPSPGGDVTSPTLTYSQVHAITQAADEYAMTLPVFDVKPMNIKKQLFKEIEDVIAMAHDTPGRMEFIKKYSAIYGRFDSKRKHDKIMTLHEVSVNEAAARLCHHQPALLTRREELFPLARAVVRDSGYQYSKGHSRSMPQPDCPLTKRVRPSPKPIPVDRVKLEERLDVVREELRSISGEHEEVRSRLAESREDQRAQLTLTLTAVSQRHTTLLAEQSDILRFLKKLDKVKKLETTQLPENTVKEENETAQCVEVKTHPAGPVDVTIANLLQNGEVKKQFMHNTLFEEGMRIAKQFGFEQLETEIKEMKSETHEQDVQ